MDPSVLTTLKILLIGQSGVGKSWWIYYSKIKLK